MPNNRATSEQIIEDLEEERLEQLLGLNENTLQSLSKSIDKLIHTAQGVKSEFNCKRSSDRIREARVGCYCDIAWSESAGV